MADHIVCRCPAYKFPHQVAAGKCTGAHWLDEYHNHTHTACDKCPAHHVASTGHGCGVLLSWVFDNRGPKPNIKDCPAFIAEKGKK